MRSCNPSSRGRGRRIITCLRSIWGYIVSSRLAKNDLVRHVPLPHLNKSLPTVLLKSMGHSRGLLTMASASPTVGSSLWPTLDALLRAEGTLVPLERCFCSPGFAKSRPSARDTTRASNGLERAADGRCFHTHPQETRRVSLQAGLLLSSYQSPLGCVQDPWATLWRDAGTQDTKIQYE